MTFGLGATVSNRDGTIDVRAISSIVEQFKSLLSYSKRIQIIAVVGAGGLGRNYVEFAKNNAMKGDDLDSIAIRASRVNALLLAAAVRNSSMVTNAKIPETMGETNRYVSSGFQAVILGCLESKMTDQSTAAIIARMNRGPLVIVSTFGGIFSDSQNKGGGKAILDKVDRAYLRRMISSKVKENVLDVQTCRILLSKKSKGMKVVMTGHGNILDATIGLLSTKEKASIKGSTLIMV